MKLSCYYAVLVIFCFLIAGCSLFSPSYPKENIHDSIIEIYKETTGVIPISKFIGKTLYVGLDLDTSGKKMQLSDELFQTIGQSLLSISRIGLSTDLDVDYICLNVIFSQFLTFRIVRKLQDIKDFFYWRISKQDLEERVVSNMGSTLSKNLMDTPSSPAAIFSTSTLDNGLELLSQGWHDITMQEFMAELIVSRLNKDFITNFLTQIVLGREMITYDIDLDNKKLKLIVDDSILKNEEKFSTLKLSIVKEVYHIEKKYLHLKLSSNEDFYDRDKNIIEWINKVDVVDRNGHLMFVTSVSEWKNFTED